MPSLLCSNMNHRFFLCAAAIVVLTIVSVATTATATATASTATTTTTTTTLYPIKIKTKKGKRSSQNIKVLQQTNNELQTGDQDIWSNYIEFKKKHDSRFQFNIGDDITDISDDESSTTTTKVFINSFSFQVNIKGPSRSKQKWIFRIRNYKRNKWETLFVNKKNGGNNWEWYTMEHSKTFDEDDNVSFMEKYTNKKNNNVLIRLKSNNRKEVLDIDYMSLILTTSTTTIENDIDTNNPSQSPSTVTENENNDNSSLLLSVGDTWTYDIGGSFSNQPYKTKVIMIDLFDTTKEKITSLKEDYGHIVCCYFSAGTYEEWRDDFNTFPSSILGNPLDEWVGERWLDITNEKTINIMTDRIQVAIDKGCDAIEPDNVDGYTNNPGFDFNKQDQINYLIKLSNIAKQQFNNKLLIGLKNAANLINTLESYFDFAIVEECYKYNECCMYEQFIQNNKPIFAIEYNVNQNDMIGLCNEFQSIDNVNNDNNHNFSLLFGNYAVSELTFCSDLLTRRRTRKTRHLANVTAAVVDDDDDDDDNNDNTNRLLLLGDGSWGNC
jgi:hypothetical protein